MPIPFECTCGKKMSAKEEFAGRRLRCPECQRVVAIPKPASGLIPTIPNPPRAPSNRLLVQPNLAKSELAAMDETRPVQREALPPKSASFDSPEKLAALFATSTTPVLSPAPPIAPVVVPAPSPSDEMLITQVVQNTEPLPAAEHPWIDQSLRQIATPWGPGDEQRFQVGIIPARESEAPLDWIVPIVVLAASIFLAV